jgi:hypothetical protein
VLSLMTLIIKGLKYDTHSLYCCLLNAVLMSQGSLTEGGRLSTVDLLVQASLDRPLFRMQTLFTLLQNKLP